MPLDKNIVRDKAKQLNDISLNYHLSHAILACNKIIESEFKEYSSKKTASLKEQLLNAEKSGNAEKIKEILRDIDWLKNHSVFILNILTRRIPLEPELYILL